MTPQQEKDSKVTRLEVINHATKENFGRMLTLYKELDEFDSIELAYQDGGRTLKIFLNPKPKI